MCGIVAMSFRHPHPSMVTGVYRTVEELKSSKKMFKQMLVSSQRRGSAATGIVISYWDPQHKKNKVKVYRAPVSAQEMVSSKEYGEMEKLIDNNMNFIFAHTRAVTGNAPAHNNWNNHPHRSGRIIGVHNGVINNHRAIWDNLTTYNIKAQGSCDSEAIFAAIEAGRIEKKDNFDAGAQALEVLKGWFAVMWMDINDPTKLFFAKDQTTELSMAWWALPRIAFIASEYITINDAANGVDHVILQKQLISSAKIYCLRSREEKKENSFIVQTRDFSLNGRGPVGEEELKLFNITRGH